MAKGLRHFEEEDDLGYDYIWIIVDSSGNNCVQAACWSETFRDSHLRAHPDHIAMRYEKADCLGEDQ